MNEPHLSFAHAMLKIEWAKVHINHLNVLCNAFIRDNPQTAIVNNEAEPGRYVVSAGMEKALPAQIPLRVGDISGNLRAALDYCWMGLIRSAHVGSGEPEKRTLPIASNRKGLISTIDKAPIGSSREQAKRILSEVVKSHRDFQDGGNKPVSILNDLSNWNKHNLIPLTFGYNVIPQFTDASGNVFNISVVGNNADVLSTDARPNLDANNGCAFDIVFDGFADLHCQPVVPTLVNLAQAAREAVMAFVNEFGEPPATNR